MAKKRKSLRGNSLLQGISLSLAGARTSGAPVLARVLRDRQLEARRDSEALVSE